MSMGCSSNRCPANSNYRYGDTYLGSGVCCKNSTSPDMLDQYAEHCGFIRVTDSWILWKWGVSYDDLKCGNCLHYEGETHGVCTNEKVKPHTKGVTVNGKKMYIDSKEYYSGARACNEFKKKEGERLAKKTYWTKCGIEFQKSSNADVTGYKVDVTNTECTSCPFTNAVTKGWPAVFDHWECRAGSQKPNHKTEWTGSLEDKNTIGINSLDNQLMEKIRQYCTEHPDLSANYNADHLADCRRTLSIGCSSNKKGIAAKKVLIEKFFPDKSESDIPLLCIDCISCKPAEHGEGHPFQHKCYNASHRVGAEFYFDESSIACKNFVQVGDASYEDIESMDLEDQLDCLLEDGDRKDKQDEIQNAWTTGMDEDGNRMDIFEPVEMESIPTRSCGKCDAGHWYSEENTYVSVVADDGIKTTKRPCEPHTHYCYQFTEGQKKIASDKDFNSDTCPEWCPLEREKAAKTMLETTDANQNATEKKKPRIGSSGCGRMREDCPYFCKHNDGCSVLLCRGEALKATIKLFGDVDCDVYSMAAETVRSKPENTPLDSVSRFIRGQESENENVIESTDIVNKEGEKAFDYSTVDADTAEFLHDKANKITEIRIKSVISIGKELKEAQDKLANNKNGTFGAWVSSIGITRQTAYNYINGYEFIAKNFDNIGAAEDISPSLLFAAAKKDAPQKLTEQVVSGDITSLKEYKVMEEKLKAAEKRVEIADNEKFIAENKAIDAAQQAKKAKKDRDDALRAYERDLDSLHQQLEQSKRNSNPTKIKELGNIISEKQQEIEDLRQQLRDKPIEVLAVKEVIPEEVRLAIYEKVSRLYEGLGKLTEAEIQIFAEDVCEDCREEVIKGTEDASEVLADIAHTIWKLTE
ncbi:hypothetical protein LY28_00041 [Ruminiclostridium sufflavum DSM 19573]|uniref:Uncharacterized protein n=1 Tax=Ruminiclostridium sufflavum DSM 19573 TaxID=1121337 RepID=A0A318XPD0_9FIRM|nr:hypothetical protein [Ruminiclostridium sufflavum]PYG90161.1 hypothetical protein LY28_00041 [Ruminiclostridium sufflavum DSM 19573]